MHGYQDDTYMLTSPGQMRDVRDALESIFAPAGLNVKIQKCFVACSSACSTGTSAIPVINVPPKVLKLPMPMPQNDGMITFDDAPVVKALAGRASFVERLLSLRQAGLKSQTCTTLAQTATMGDINYLAQCVPLAASIAEQFEKELLHGVHDILNIDRENGIPGPERWFLPIRDGGFGFTGVYHSTEALYLGSLLPAVVRCAGRHDMPCPQSLLDKLPIREQHIVEIAWGLHGEGVAEAASVSDLLLRAKDAHLASR